ncbi:MAG: alanine--tRNA ligase-related protein [Chitinophagales bacterium]
MVTRKREAEARIVKMRTVSAKKEKHFQIVLDTTPFYAESGGQQIGDTGTLTIGSQVIRVTDTKKENDLIIHYTDELPVDVQAAVHAAIDSERRTSIIV